MGGDGENKSSFEYLCGKRNMNMNMKTCCVQKGGWKNFIGIQLRGVKISKTVYFWYKLFFRPQTSLGQKSPRFQETGHFFVFAVYLQCMCSIWPIFRPEMAQNMKTSRLEREREREISAGQAAPHVQEDILGLSCTTTGHADEMPLRLLVYETKGGRNRTSPL